MRRMLDLYAGLGGASDPFLMNPKWEITRIDNNPLLKDVPNMTMLDLLSSTQIPVGTEYLNCDLIWASPPCDDFSLGFHAPAPTAQREGRIFEPDLKPLLRAIQIISFLKPKWWVIENVAGASKIFSEVLGVERPTQIIRPYFLWGKFPHIEMPHGWKLATGKTERWEIDDPLRKNKRGVVDFEVGSALMRAIEAQTTLEDFL